MATQTNSAAQCMTRAGETQLLDWRSFDSSRSAAQRGRHCLADKNLFTDDLLIDLLDSYPRNRLQAWTMGLDPLRREDWKAVDTEGISGRELLEAVKSGRLWYNVLRLDLFDRKYRDIVDQLYREMAELSPGFQPLSAVATLLLSSPDAQVYYHADGPPTTLFHVRGKKRMWIYPANDERFVSRYFLEEIFGSAMDEEVPYKSEFDDFAVCFDLEPGDAIWWPLNAPHRIQNLGSFNVSLSTRYQTMQSEQRKLVYTANRFFRRKIGLHSLGVNESGLACFMKCLVYRLCRRAGLDRGTPGYVYKTTLRVDANAPLGLRTIPEKKAAFSK